MARHESECALAGHRKASVRISKLPSAFTCTLTRCSMRNTRPMPGCVQHPTPAFTLLFAAHFAEGADNALRGHDPASRVPTSPAAIGVDAKVTHFAVPVHAVGALLSVSGGAAVAAVASKIATPDKTDRIVNP